MKTIDFGPKHLWTWSSILAPCVVCGKDTNNSYNQQRCCYIVYNNCYLKLIRGEDTDGNTERNIPV